MKKPARSLTESRKKPPVAFVSEHRARENITRKLDALRGLLDAGTVSPEMPTSLRRFNAWTRSGSGDNLPLFRNSNVTLSRYVELSQTAKVLVTAAKAAGRPVPKAREIGLARARERAALHQRIRQIAEAELIRARGENTRLRAEIQALRAQSKSMTEETARIREEYEVALAALRSQHAEVVRALRSKVRLIRT